MFWKSLLNYVIILFAMRFLFYLQNGDTFFKQSLNLIDNKLTLFLSI